MSVLGSVALAAAGVAALAWLVVSFSAPGTRRTIVEWVGTLGLYGALLAFFLKLARSAWLESSLLALVAFGFLAAIFAAGSVLTLHRIVQLLRGRAAVDQSATH